MKTKSLNDKVILVTGASSGLGEQIAYLSVKQGATVVVAARRLERLLQVQKRCASYSGGDASAFKLDISDREQTKQVIEAVYSQHGKIDVLVNNAGFGIFSEALEFDVDMIESMFQVNVLGLMYITQLVGQKMAVRKQGHIINIASQGGKMATPKSSVYSATKFAVIGFSNALRLELKPLNIHVTTVNPGPIRTTFFDNADKSGEYLRSVGRFILAPELVAEKVVAAMGTSKREINLPFTMELASRLYNLFPHIGDYLAGTIFNRK